MGKFSSNSTNNRSVGTNKRTTERLSPSAHALLPLDRTMCTMRLDADVSNVSGVSAARSKALKKMGISTVGDLVTLYPRRYIDLSNVACIASAPIGENCTIRGNIYDMKLKRPRAQLVLVEITLVDNTGTLIITAFRQPWLMNTLSPGATVAVAGKVEFNYGFKRMTNPFIEEIDVIQTSDAGLSDGVIIPVHPACAEISAAWMRRLVKNALNACDALEDFLPLELRKKHALMSRRCALRAIHFPHSMHEKTLAHKRLAYEEVLLLQLALMQNGARGSRKSTAEGAIGKDGTAEGSAGEAGGISHVIQGVCVRNLYDALPFSLTNDQKTAIQEILEVMHKPMCANHMLLGDVGTGKTIVCAFALAAVADTHTQAAVMAPTEVLARQYAQSIGPLLTQLGISWDTLTGSTPAYERASILSRLQSGEIHVLFGTHALIEPDVQFRSCSLCVIDEQQRFGVKQRARLLEKGHAPDALYLTATPIPRSLALTLFGNLTLSYVRERPFSGACRCTKVYTRDNEERAYQAAREALERGEQVYVVCPLIGLSTEQRNARAHANMHGSQNTAGARTDTGAQLNKKKGTSPQTYQTSHANQTHQTQDDYYEFSLMSIESEQDYAHENVAAATTKAKILQDTLFYDFRVALLHGKMTSAEKQKTMDNFRSGAVQVLVATTVIEVGVDVAHATVMIIEDADRFGLSQLHQLRGRVGRSELASQVFLISNSSSSAALDRLRAMEQTDDGFELASYDLSLRREGDILGNRQHGTSTLKLINVVRDSNIIQAAHDDAQELLSADPQLMQTVHRSLAREVRALCAQAEIVGS